MREFNLKDEKSFNFLIGLTSKAKLKITKYDIECACLI
jgi:hypothetical protein